MAHKHNPIAAISARAAAMQVPGLVATLLTAAGSGEAERAAGAWHAEWPALHQLLRATGSARPLGRRVARRLQVDTARMAANLAAPTSDAERRARSGDAEPADGTRPAMAACGGRCSATPTSTGRPRGGGIDADFQRWITEAAWGGLWTRDGELDRRTRSCITVAVLTALRAEAELALHLRAARRNGVTEAELAEVIMHTRGYAGIPAANSAMSIAKQVFAEPEP